MHLPDSIKPFNHPLLIAIKKIAPALAAGNSVIVKPSEVIADIIQRGFVKFLTAVPKHTDGPGYGSGVC